MPSRDMYIQVDLTPEEISICGEYVMIRRREGERLGAYRHRSKDRPVVEQLLHEREGLFGEAAMARYLGIPFEPWNMINRFKGGSGIGGFEVTSTCESDGVRNLIVRDNDIRHGRPMVLTLNDGVYPMVTLVGWLPDPARAPDIGRLRNPGPGGDSDGKRASWFVSKSVLDPMSSIVGPLT